MAGPRPPINSPADYAIQLEILRKIESFGGSAGHDANPDAFNDFVPALDPFDSDVWTKIIDELTEHEKDSDAQALKARLQAEVDFHRSVRVAVCKCIILVSEIIKGIESLGGSVGFQKFTENSRALPKAGEERIAASSGWSSCHAWGFVASAWFVTALHLYANGYQGSGHAWGLALGVGHMQGVLTYNKFDANGFNFQNLIGAATASMTLNGTQTSRFVGAVIGASVSMSFGGDWHW
ncbi:hypothetical protein J3R83DRAFT_7035 [Lanmaoa asiatica]|nr:hypothetical protein J3R83DRAFT_7035 [Lanmaoa asiatica]